jgi:hypothetical protein
MQEPSRRTRQVEEALAWEIDIIRSNENRFGRLDQAMKGLTEMSLRRFDTHDKAIAKLQVDLATLKASMPTKLTERLPLPVREIIGWAIIGALSMAGALNGDAIGQKLADTLIGRAFH